jgi:hypothetical protein
MTKQIKKTKAEMMKHLMLKPVVCFKCSRQINRNVENFIELTSFNKGEIIEDAVWHATCWGEWNQDKVNARIIEIQKLGLNMLQRAGMVSL